MKGKKKILLAVVLVLVMAVGITSIVVIRNRNKTVVKVFPVSMLNSSDWFDTDTSLTGTLTSDYIQEVHIDGGQKVKKVYVKKGDKVKKGDILLKYNVSEKELDLKLQKLQIQSSKMEIAEMEKEHIICGYHTLINWDNTSEEKVVALIEVKVTPQRGMGFDKIAERIYQYNEVNAVYLMSGSFDFTVFIEGKTMRQVAQFVSDKLAPLDSVLSTATHFVLKKYKDHGTVLCDEVQDERMLITP